ncbi:MAG: MFS transporter [Bradymonadia bacterium]
MRTSHKLGLLGALYFSQGLPFGFFTQALPVFLRDQGISLAGIGLTYLLALPWALKFIWAPFIDRHQGGRWGPRRSWILPLQWLAAALMAVLSAIDPSVLWVLLTGVMLTNLLAATQDVATDGLALSLLTVDERGPGNGVQVAGYRVGMIIGGGALLVAYEDLGWTGTFLSMSGLLLVATIPLLRHREAPRRQAPSKPLRWGRILKGFVAMPGAWSWLLVLILYKGADAMASAMAKPMLKDLGLGLGDIGWLMGFAGFGAGLLGAIGGGFGVKWLGRRRALLIFGALQSTAVAGYVLPASGSVSPEVLYGVVIADTFAGGLATAALFTLMMDACRPHTEASDYTLQASVVVLGTGVTSALSGFLAEAWGYADFFLFAGITTFLGLMLCLLILRRGRFRFPGLTPEAHDDATVEVFS